MWLCFSPWTSVISLSFPPVICIYYQILGRIIYPISTPWPSNSLSNWQNDKTHTHTHTHTHNTPLSHTSSFFNPDNSYYRQFLPGVIFLTPVLPICLLIHSLNVQAFSKSKPQVSDIYKHASNWGRMRTSTSNATARKTIECYDWGHRERVLNPIWKETSLI
jgi:hypothetical protein